MIFGLDKVIAKVVLKKYAKKYLEGKNMPTQGQVRKWGTIVGVVGLVLTSVAGAVTGGTVTISPDVSAWVEKGCYVVTILLQLLKKDK